MSAIIEAKDFKSIAKKEEAVDALREQGAILVGDADENDLDFYLRPDIDDILTNLQEMSIPVGTDVGEVLYPILDLSDAEAFKAADKKKLFDKFKAHLGYDPKNAADKDKIFIKIKDIMDIWENANDVAGEDSEASVEERLFEQVVQEALEDIELEEHVKEGLMKAWEIELEEKIGEDESDEEAGSDEEEAEAEEGEGEEEGEAKRKGTTQVAPLPIIPITIAPKPAVLVAPKPAPAPPLPVQITFAKPVEIVPGTSSEFASRREIDVWIESLKQLPSTTDFMTMREVQAGVSKINRINVDANLQRKIPVQTRAEVESKPVVVASPMPVPVKVSPAPMPVKVSPAPVAVAPLKLSPVPITIAPSPAQAPPIQIGVIPVAQQVKPAAKIVQAVTMLPKNHPTMGAFPMEEKGTGLEKLVPGVLNFTAAGTVPTITAPQVTLRPTAGAAAAAGAGAAAASPVAQVATGDYSDIDWNRVSSARATKGASSPYDVAKLKEIATRLGLTPGNAKKEQLVNMIREKAVSLKLI